MERDFAAIVREQVFVPLGIEHSSFVMPSDDRVAARAHIGRSARPMPGHSLRFRELAAAGLWSTASDLVRMASGVCTSAAGAPSALLSQRTALEMLESCGTNYGLGFGLVDPGDGKVFVHSGSNPGYRARWFTYADGRGGVAVLTNSDNGQKLIDEITSAIGAHYGWAQDALEVRESLDLDPSWLRGLEGVYHLDSPDGPSVLTLTLEGGALWVDGLVPRCRLHASSNSEFYTADGLELQLELDPAGRPLHLLIEGEVRLVRPPLNRSESESEARMGTPDEHG